MRDRAKLMTENCECEIASAIFLDGTKTNGRLEKHILWIIGIQINKMWIL